METESKLFILELNIMSMKGISKISNFFSVHNDIGGGNLHAFYHLLFYSWFENLLTMELEFS